MTTLDLLVEVTPGMGCFAHVPALPGLCFRANSIKEAKETALSQVVNYIGWTKNARLFDLNPIIATLASQSSDNPAANCQLVEKELLEGSPLWISGNPAALFDYDLHLFDDPTVNTYLRFTRHVLTHMGEIINTLPDAQRDKQSNHEHRSIKEMLTHIGNCVWWYCSRIDDGLPEPDEDTQETPFHRIMRLLDFADQYLESVPSSEREVVHIPTRFRTSDPSEQWTHTKVCRREAEHAWEHLSELQEIAAIARAS